MRSLIGSLAAAMLLSPAAESSGGAAPPSAPAEPAAPAPAAPPEKLSLFTPTEPAPAPVEPPAAEPKVEEPAPVAPAPVAPEDRPGAIAARAALAQREAERQKAAFDAQAKELEQAKARLAKIDRFKEDPRLLLEEAGITFEELSKKVLNGPPADPRTLELKAAVEEVKGEIAKRDAALQQRDFTMAVAQVQGRIDAALSTGDKYEQARAAGWTPEKVWGEMEIVFKQTGRLPTHAEVLDAIEQAELDALVKVTSTAKAKARLAPAAPAPVAKPPAPTKTLSASQAAPPARVNKPRTTEQIISDFLQSGRKLRDP